MKTIPHITIEQAVAIDKQDPDYWYAVVNERIDEANNALAEQQESEYITAEQALEEAVAVCGKVPYQNDNYVAGVELCKSAIKELIK